MFFSASQDFPSWSGIDELAPFSGWAIFGRVGT